MQTIIAVCKGDKDFSPYYPDWKDSTYVEPTFAFLQVSGIVTLIEDVTLHS
jgi:hypothetical protein